MFSFEFCEISKNIFSTEHLWWLLLFIWLSGNAIFEIHNLYGMKLLTRLPLDLSRLHEHKFRHFVQEISNPFCAISKGFESVMIFYLYCTNFRIPKQTLFQNTKNIDRFTWSTFNSILSSGSRNYDLTITVIRSWRRCLSYRNKSIDLQSESIDWFLYDRGPLCERVKRIIINLTNEYLIFTERFKCSFLMHD